MLNERGLKADGGMEFPEAAQLEKTDVLIIHCQDGMKIVGEDREAFEKFLARGGGVVVIHAGVVGGDQHEWIKKIIGGAWRWPSPELPREKATQWLEGDVGLCWIDEEHPISHGMSNFDWKDEIYYDLDLASDIGVLATSFHNVHIIAPQIWTYEKTLSGTGVPPVRSNNEPQPPKPETHGRDARATTYRAFVSLPGHE